MDMQIIKQELAEIRKDPPSNCSAGPVDETKDLYTWQATIMGPVNNQTTLK